MAWTDTEIALALRLFSEGKSYSQIGTIMGRTKGAISGVMNRHGRGFKRPAKNQPAQQPTYIPNGCQYPHGHPGSPDFHFCEQPVKRGKPYCETHCAVCYRPKGDA